MHEWILTAILAAFAAMSCGVQLTTASGELEKNGRSKIAGQFRTLAGLLFFLLAVSVGGGLYLAWGIKTGVELKDNKITNSLIFAFLISSVSVVAYSVFVGFSLWLGSKDFWPKEPPSFSGDRYLSQISESLGELVRLKEQELKRQSLGDPATKTE